MNETYWGPFARILELAGPAVEQTSFYEGEFASLYDQLASPIGDIAGYLALASRHRGPVLELACGTGRVLLPLAEAGHEVTGLDISEQMLAILRESLASRPREVQERVSIVTADAATFDLGRQFALIILPFCTVALFGEEERAKVIARAAAHLAPGGAFAFDFPSRTHNGDLEDVVTTASATIGGAKATLRVGLRTAPAGDALLANTYCEIEQPGGGTRRLIEARRIALLDDAELRNTLAACGLEVVETHGPDTSGVPGATRFVCHTRDDSYPLLHPYAPPFATSAGVVTIVEGKGSRVRDREGNEYIDACAGLWSVNCGFGVPEIADAVAAQLRRLSFGSLFAGRTNEPALALARALVQLAPGRMPAAFLTCTGSESVELAMKLARLHFSLNGEPHRHEIVHLDASYHGTYFGSMGVSGIFEEKHAFAPLLPGVSSIAAPLPWRRAAGVSEEAHAIDCARALERRIDESDGRVAAFLFEPVLASAGVVVPPPAWFETIAEICRSRGVLMIVDEVATGFGRTGSWLASHRFGLEPDLLLLAKGISNGYLPLGAVLVGGTLHDRLVERQEVIGHGSSHNGNPACCAAALATIEVMRRDRLVERAEEIGALLHERLAARLTHASVAAIRSCGLMLAIDFVQEDGSELAPLQFGMLLRAAQQAGVLTYPTLRGIILMPPLVLTREEVDEISERIGGVLDTMRFAAGAVT